jgi:hypothetical protein
MRLSSSGRHSRIVSIRIGRSRLVFCWPRSGCAESGKFISVVYQAISSLARQRVARTLQTSGKRSALRCKELHRPVRRIECAAIVRHVVCKTRRAKVDHDGTWPHEDQMRQAAVVCRNPMTAAFQHLLRSEGTFECNVRIDDAVDRGHFRRS